MASVQLSYPWLADGLSVVSLTIFIQILRVPANCRLGAVSPWSIMNDNCQQLLHPFFKSAVLGPSVMEMMEKELSLPLLTPD